MRVRRVRIGWGPVVCNVSYGLAPGDQSHIATESNVRDWIYLDATEPNTHCVGVGIPGKGILEIGK